MFIKNIELEQKEQKKKNITIHDIAEKLGISASTVSRALNDHSKININTKESVWALAKQMGYYPNVPVYMNKGNKPNVCLIVPEFSSFYKELIDGAQSYFNKKSIFLYVLCSQHSNEYEKAMLAESYNLGMKGIILAVFDNDKEINNLIENYLNELPIVLVNKFEDDLPVSKIIPDVYNGTYKAVNHLYSVGCRKIGLFTSSNINPLYAEMRSGYESAIKSLNLELNDNYICSGSFKQNDISHEIDKIINQNDRPEGLLVENQFAAQQIIAYLRSAGLNVPQDMAIVSFGNEPFSPFVSPSLSSVAISAANIGHLAAKQLYKTMHDKTVEPITLVEQAKIIIRGSSMRLKTENI